MCLCVCVGICVDVCSTDTQRLTESDLMDYWTE